MRCVIWYNLYNLKNTYGGALILVLKVTLLHEWFLRFLNGTNDTKSCKASHIFLILKKNPTKTEEYLRGMSHHNSKLHYLSLQQD